MLRPACPGLNSFPTLLARLGYNNIRAVVGKRKRGDETLGGVVEGGDVHAQAWGCVRLPLKPDLENDLEGSCNLVPSCLRTVTFGQCAQWEAEL